MKWVCLTTAPDQLVGEMWGQLLRSEGVPAAIRAGDTSSFLGVSSYPCRILVREDHLERAKEILETNLGREAE